MEHLNQDELLLLADGELAEERAAHVDACSQCAAAAGAMQGQLTAITAQLRASAPAESPESHSASWARLEAAIRGESQVFAAHLLPEELLLHLDDELAPERALHLESCEDCHDDLLRVQALLFDIEHELRALIPAESPERRLAAAAVLEQKLYPPKKVISFPVRWGAVYAAAAALTFAMFGGLWMAQKSPAPVEPAQIAEAQPAQATPVAPQRVLLETAAPKPAPEPAVQRLVPVSAPEPAELERFELAAIEPASGPLPTALPADASLAIRPRTVGTLDLAWVAPPVPAFQIAVSQSSPTPKADPEALIAGLSAAVRSGAWSRNVTPELRDGRLVYAGVADSEQDREELIASIRGELNGRDAAFEIAVSNRRSPLAGRGVQRTLGDRPAGGMMRSALIEHYSDAARRSFQQPTQSALEAEIARFASEIYRSQSSLVRHAHALSTLLAETPTESLSPAAAQSLADLVRFHASGVAESEAKIYDHLSEALPRRFWNHRGDRGEFTDNDAVAAGRQLLADALRLDETLTTLLGSSAGTVDVGEVDASAGALLYRIRTRARNLTSGLDSVR